MQSAGAAWTIDESTWPVVQVTVTPGPRPLDDFVADVQRMQAAHALQKPFAFVVDIRQASAPGAAERRVIASSMAESEQRFPGHLRAVAVVSTSPLARGVFAALHWLAPPRYAMKVFSDPRDALAWARDHVPADGAADAGETA